MGGTRHHGWRLYSRRFREWLAQTFLNDHALYPGCHALDFTISMLAANARSSKPPAGHIFTASAPPAPPFHPPPLSEAGEIGTTMARLNG